VPDEKLQTVLADQASDSGLELATDIEELKKCNIFIITVPTPIDDHKTPDFTPLRNATATLASILKKEDLVIYESTVYPGATEEICVPILEKISGLRFNEDFYVGYSPERINPGDKKRTLTNIVKVVAGSTPEITKRMDTLYSSIVEAG